jgi:hypothetical protein
LTAARLDFAGVRFAGAAFRLDGVGLAERRAVGFVFFAGAFFAEGPDREGFFACGDGPLAVAARTSVPPDAEAATGAPAAGADAPSPSQNLISARSAPPGLR